MTRTFGFAGIALAATTLFAAGARADIPSPERTACSGKKVGDACVVESYGGEPGRNGVCTDRTCSRPGPDGSHEFPCVECVVPADKPPEKAPPEKAPAVTPAPKSQGSASSVDPDRSTKLWTSIGVGVLALGAGVGAASRSSAKRRD